MTRDTRKFNGKIYERRGPIYCPDGTRWEWLKEEIETLRKNHLVRVVKEKIHYKPGTPQSWKGNTHVVWLYVRRK
jgi:hypothetical protein